MKTKLSKYFAGVSLGLMTIKVLASLDQGLIAYYPFDGNAQDISGNGNHGILSNNVLFSPGKFGQAVLFNNQTELRVTVPDAEILDTPYAFTLSAWINPSERRTTGGYHMIFSKWFTYPTIGEYILGFQNNLVLQVANTDDGFKTDSLASSEAIPLNEWSHVAATFDHGMMKLFFNGQVVAEKQSQVVTHLEFSEYSQDNFYIGNLWTNQFYKYGFVGNIDEARLYNRALSACEIEELYSGNEACHPRLTINKLGNGTGTVTSEPTGIDCGIDDTDCIASYSIDTPVTLTATPQAGSTFEGWDGDCAGTEPTTEITLDNSKECVAIFLKPLAVTLSHSTLTPLANGFRLSWQTGYEDNCAGFQLWRAWVADGQCWNKEVDEYQDITQLTEQLLIAEGEGSSYTFDDLSINPMAPWLAANGGADTAAEGEPGYCYGLEAVHFDGSSSFYLLDPDWEGWVPLTD